MKYHKIRNVPLETCTAEQKIAYNIATYNEYLRDRYNAARKISAVCASEIFDEILGIAFNSWMRSPDNHGKFDNDAIWCCLRAGFANYLVKPFIAWDYETIGKSFPASYLN